MRFYLQYLAVLVILMVATIAAHEAGHVMMVILLTWSVPPELAVGICGINPCTTSPDLGPLNDSVQIAGGLLAFVLLTTVWAIATTRWRRSRRAIMWATGMAAAGLAAHQMSNAVLEAFVTDLYRAGSAWVTGIGIGYGAAGVWLHRLATRSEAPRGSEGE